jgi:hypothetical protein
LFFNPEHKLEKIIARAMEIWKGADFDADFESISQRTSAEMSEGASHGRRAVRLCGQSGSGKSTQLLPMAQKYLAARGVRPVHIAVRNFVKYFPALDSLGVPEREVREATNAFCLLLMLRTIGKLAEAGADLLIELAMLEPLFEETIIGALAGYDAELYGIACPRRLSDGFIAKRELESGRIVKKESADYFWHWYESGFNAWAAARPDMPCVLWSVLLKEPAYDGTIVGAVSALKKCLSTEGKPLPEGELLDAKLGFILRRAARFQDDSSS